MTALLGAILLVAFLTEGVTILSVNQLFTWHVSIGLFIVPLVCVKLATTGYRFFNYYRGNTAYRRKGAPHPVLRVTAPLLVLSTISLLGAGIAALAVGPRRSDTWITIHQASAIAWMSLAAIHVIGHAFETWRLTNAEVRANPPLPRRGARTAVVACGLVVGLILGVASLGWTDAWKDRRHHRDGAPSVVVRPDLIENHDALR